MELNQISKTFRSGVAYILISGNKTSFPSIITPFGKIAFNILFYGRPVTNTGWPFLKQKTEDGAAKIGNKEGIEFNEKNNWHFDYANGTSSNLDYRIFIHSDHRYTISFNSILPIA